MRALALVALLVFAAPATAQVTAKEAADLVNEYVFGGTTVARRAEIVHVLLRAPEARTLAPLKKAAKVAPGLAVQLAARIRHPKTWALVLGALPSDDEAHILAPLFPDPPGDARSGLMGRWVSLDAGSPSHELLTKFYEHYPETASMDIEVFVTHIRGNDEARKRAAARIVGRILGIQAEGEKADPAAVLARWEGVSAAWRLHSQAFRTTGDPFLSVSEKSGAFQARGANYLVGPQGVIRFAGVGTLDAVNHDVAFRFFPMDDTGFAFTYESEQGAWTLRANAGALTIKTGDNLTASLPFAVGEWNEIRYSATCTPGPFAGDRRVVLSVNGKALAGGLPLRLNGHLEFFAFSGDAGRVVIAAAEIVRR